MIIETDYIIRIHISLCITHITEFDQIWHENTHIFIYNFMGVYHSVYNKGIIKHKVISIKNEEALNDQKK